MIRVYMCMISAFVAGLVFDCAITAAIRQEWLKVIIDLAAIAFLYLTTRPHLRMIDMIFTEGQKLCDQILNKQAKP